MSKPDDIEQLWGDVFRKARSRGLQERMEAFTKEHGSTAFKAVRDEAATGASLSELVDEERV